MHRVALRHVDQHGPRGELVQGLPRRARIQLPRPGGRLRREGPDRQPRHEVGLLFAEQHFEDFEEQGGGRRALGEPVQTVDQPAVGPVMSRVCHRDQPLIGDLWRAGRGARRQVIVKKAFCLWKGSTDNPLPGDRRPQAAKSGHPSNETAPAPRARPFGRSSGRRPAR